MDFEDQAGVNVEEVAAPQTEQVETVQDTGANEPGAADPKPVQDAETNARYAEQRRNQELNDIRSKAEQDRKALERVAMFNGYDSHDEYLDAIDQAELQQQAQRAGIDPAVYREQQELKSTVNTMQQELQSYKLKDTRYEQDKALESDPNVGELYKQYRDEVKQLAESANTDYDIAFTLLLRDKLPTLLTGLKSQAEQETIRKLQQNETTSTGSLGAGEPSHTTSIGQMGKADFGSLVQQVLRGERKTL